MKKKIVSCLLVGVMCTLIGSVAYADESGSESRADSIKSHGTLLCEQADSDDEVYITTQDMINLANDVDRLEDLIDGLQGKDNPNIEYIYHKHAGTPYVTGGCITAWHEHTDDCPYHNGDKCDEELTEINHGLYQKDGTWFCRFKCREGHISIYEHIVTNCHHKPKIYDCGNSPMNQWSYVCGKTEGVTIDSAIITFP